MTAVQERRLRELRSRLLVRAFDYRQRRRARGVWFRLRRALALAQVAEGHAADPVGGELEPPRIIVVVSAERVARIASARPLAVRLSAEVLSAECLAVVPFPAELS